MSDRIVVQLYAPDGTPVAQDQLRALMITDLTREPFPRTLCTPVEEGLVHITYPGVPLVFAYPLPVTGFRRVYLFAEAGGKGYYKKQADILNLNLEFAHSRLQAVAKLEKKMRRSKVNTKRVAERLEHAKNRLETAHRARQVARVAALCDESLQESLRAGEELVLEVARYRIQRIGWREAFLLGCNLFGFERGEEYRSLFARLFNHATLPLYWREIESLKGQLELARIDRMLEWTQRGRVIPKGHPLVRFRRDALPEWTHSMDFGEMVAALEERIRTLVERYRGRIRYWDVIDEAHDWANALNFTHEQLVMLTRLACEWVKSVDAHAVCILNTGCPVGEYVADGVHAGGAASYPPRSAFAYLSECVAAEIPFECIGLKLHHPGLDLFEIDRLLERYADLGKPIHITALSVPSAGESAGGLERWSEKAQADWVEAIYTLCYSKPYIVAISWWDLADNEHFYPHSGLLHANLEPKESYLRLQTLIQGWRQLRE